MRILVVDDNPDALRTLGALLALEGHTVGLAGSGIIALTKAAEGAFDVIILDIRMPGLNGYEVASKIRELGIAHQPRIIAVSGLPPRDADTQKDWGVDAYLQKPIAVEALLAAIKSPAKQ